MKNKSIIFLTIIINIFVIINLSGCSYDKEKEDIKTKVIQELEYLDTHIINTVNKLNNISLQNYTITSKEITKETVNTTQSSEGNKESEQGGTGGNKENSENDKITTTQMEKNSTLEIDENNIDWSSISTDIETINEVWGIVLLDLSSLGINGDNILAFSTILDESILSIKNKDKAKTLINLAKLYELIPKYEEAISAPNDIKVIKQTKAYIINAYVAVEQEDWNNVQNNITKTDETFRAITNDLEYVKDREYKVNKTYVLIKELENSLTYKDKKLFFMKYKNLMESINTL